MDPATAAVVASAGTSAGNAGTQLYQNWQQRKDTAKANWQNYQQSGLSYYISRRDALKDRDFENSYNSPEQQMQRLKAAGLNPHLIYGNVNNMASSRTNNSNTETKEVNAPKTEIGGFLQGLGNIGNIFSQYIDIQKIQAQTQNLDKQREYIDAQIRNAGKTGTSIDLSNQHSTFDLDVKQTMRQTRQKQEVANLRKTEADTVYTISENERQDLMNNANVQLAHQHMLTQIRTRALMMEQQVKSQQERQKIRAEIEQINQAISLSKDEQLIKKVHLDMYDDGMTPSDPAYSRAFIQLLNAAGRRSKQIKNYLTPSNNQKGVGGAPTR